MSDKTVTGIGVAIIAYVLLSLLAFNLRHPWATEIECWSHIGDALTWKTVPYTQRLLEPDLLRAGDKQDAFAGNSGASP